MDLNEANKAKNEEGDKDGQETEKNEISTPSTDDKLTGEKVKDPIIKWNGDINFGNILTIIVIVISAWTLYYNKKGVETKVEDLQAVVKSLEEEKLTRQLQGLEGETNRLNSFSYNLGYTVDQIQGISDITNYEFLFMLTELNAMIDLQLKRNDLIPVEKTRLELFKQRNIQKQTVFLLSNMYSKAIEEFEKKNLLKEDNFKSTDAFLVARRKYNDTLKKHIDILLHIQDSLSKEPIRKVKELEEKYVELENRKSKVPE